MILTCDVNHRSYRCDDTAVFFLFHPLNRFFFLVVILYNNLYYSFSAVERAFIQSLKHFSHDQIYFKKFLLLHRQNMNRDKFVHLLYIITQGDITKELRLMPTHSFYYLGLHVS